MVVTLQPMLTEAMLLHWLNVPSLIVVRLSGRMILARLLQLEKAYCPMLVTLWGM